MTSHDHPLDVEPQRPMCIRDSVDGCGEATWATATEAGEYTGRNGVCDEHAVLAMAAGYQPKRWEDL